MEVGNLKMEDGNSEPLKPIQEVGIDMAVTQIKRWAVTFSIFSIPVSNFQFPFSSFQFPFSSFQFPVSSRP